MSRSLAPPDVANRRWRLYCKDCTSPSLGRHRLRWTDVHHLHNHIAIVNQTPNLFDGTVRDNIMYKHLGELTDDDTMRAAWATHVHDFVMSLP